MNTKITKSQLAEIIKAVVQECINERKEKWIQKAVAPSHKGYCTPITKSTCTPHRKALAIRFKKGELSEQEMQEIAPPGFGPDKKHAKIYNKIKSQYPNNDAAAYATMWKVYKKLKETVSEAGLTSEKDEHAKKVQIEPDLNETAYKTQGSSAKTFKDSPQFPDAVNNPKNA